MRTHFQIFVLSLLMSGLAACGAGGSEPSEAQMREGMLYAMNHPPGIKVSDPITIKFFKKEACEAKPSAQGFHCTFDVQVASANLGASMYNNISMGEFYIDKETRRWNMRPPF
jgi:hypothetical protein